jgi:hypothetical protein
MLSDAFYTAITSIAPTPSDFAAVSTAAASHPVGLQ